MPINQQNPAPRQPEGWAPDADPTFARTIAEAWHAINLEEEEGGRAMAHPGVLLRASDAAACARSLGYRVQRRIAENENILRITTHGSDADLVEVIPPSNPPTIADSYRMAIGKMVHDKLVEPLAAAFPDATVEVELLEEGVGISMHADIYEPGPPSRMVEVKTINGFGFKKARLEWQGPAGGPRWNAVVQGALAAAERDVDVLTIVYFSLELLGNDVVKRNKLDELDRFTAQWTLDREQYTLIAEAERKRMAAVVKLVKEGKLPPRSIPSNEIPHGNRIVNPAKGDWEVVDAEGKLINLGTTWMCGYCWERDRCITDGPS